LVFDELLRWNHDATIMKKRIEIVTITTTITSTIPKKTAMTQENGHEFYHQLQFHHHAVHTRLYFTTMEFTSLEEKWPQMRNIIITKIFGDLM
jgi:deoxyadenosine/deoxycytidine kinase